MAEVVGLLFGALSIVSLFTTCVDLLDRTELGLRHEAESQLAIDKVGLLRLRLTNWGAALGISGETSPAPELHPTVEQDLVARSLVHIRTKLESALKLEEKHQAKSKGISNLRLTDSDRVETPTGHHRQNAIAIDLTSWRKGIRLRRRTQWALHDKQRFDALIQDLSFLIENLEKVTASNMSSSTKVIVPGDSKSKSALDGKQEIQRAIIIKKDEDALSTHSNGSCRQARVSKVLIDPNSFTHVHQNDQENEDALGIIGETVGEGTVIAVKSLHSSRQKNSKRAIGIIGVTSTEVVKSYLAADTADDAKAQPR